MGTGAIVPGTTDTGNHVDDGDTPVTLPFPYTLYNQTFSSVNVDSNGRLDFVTQNDPGGYTNECLPATPNLGPYDYTIFAHWDDQRTDNFSGTGEGIFTSVSGTAPNRIFNIEWRTEYYDGGGTANYEVRLYEGQAKFDIIYGAMAEAGSGATVGVQGPSGLYTEYECDSGGLTTGLMLTFTSSGCGTATNTPTPGGPTVTPTPCGSTPSWSAGPDFPSAVTRSVGVWFPTNGKFYSLGGRFADGTGNDILNPYEYDPVANTWTQKSATFDDTNVDNMVARVLIGPSGPRIYTVGGSSGGLVTATSEVRVYDPVGNTISALTSDPWPGSPSGDILPGGAAVVNNKMYVLGGFQINIAMIPDIWEFDPNRPAGTMWVHKSAVLPLALGYIPTTAIGNFVYTGGGSDYQAGALLDTTNSYKYDPATDTITAIASIPRATAETRAVTVGGKMWVLGGGRVAPNPSNEVDVYDPGTDTWSIGPCIRECAQKMTQQTVTAVPCTWLVGMTPLV